jgi:transposase InsO family protein
VLMK